MVARGKARVRFTLENEVVKKSEVRDLALKDKSVVESCLENLPKKLGKPLKNILTSLSNR